MPGNTLPQFAATGIVGSVLVTAANTSSAGGGTIATDIFLANTSGTNGTWIDFIRWIPVATAPTAMTATTLRIFFSTQASGATTSANTYLVHETTGPASSADSATVGVPYIDVFIGQRLPASMTVLVTNHAAPAANSNWRAIVFGGDY
jgi:hypothetical protein